MRPARSPTASLGSGVPVIRLSDPCCLIAAALESRPLFGIVPTAHSFEPTLASAKEAGRLLQRPW